MSELLDVENDSKCDPYCTMEALAVIGLVGNIIQFIDFSRRVVAKLIQVNQSGEATIAEIIHIQRTTKDLVSLKANLEDAVACTGDRNLWRLCESCNAVAIDLLAALEKIEFKESHSKWGNTKRALKSIWDKQAIERLERRLATYRNELNLRIVVGLRGQVSTLQLAQEDNMTEFKTMSASQSSLITTFHAETISRIAREHQVTRREMVAEIRRNRHEASLPIHSPQSKVLWVVPLMRNQRFVGRGPQLREIEAKLFVEGYCPRVAIVGLGGVGKTQIALELACQVRSKRPDCSVFWVAATTYESVQLAFREIGRQLRVPGIEDREADVKDLVRSCLCNENAGKWLLILDNVDDFDIWFGASEGGTESGRIIDCLPTSSKGSIVLTTRSRKVAVELARNHIVLIPPIDEEVGAQILTKSLLNQAVLDDTESVTLLLTQLAFLPLAIVQAAAYINKNDISVSEYLSLLNDTEENVIRVFSEAFEDEGRYLGLNNPVAMTWLISFEKARRHDPLAAEYLSFMSCVDSKMIPQSVLPPPETKKMMLDAIGTLTAYSFITRQPESHSFDVHRLVHLATRNWLRGQNSLGEWTCKTMKRLVEVFPASDHSNRTLWSAYLPHARFILASDAVPGNTEARIALLEISGLCLQRDGRYAEAREYLIQVVDATEEALGKEHPETLRCLSNLAIVLRYQGMYKDAETMCRRALEGREKVFGEEHPDSLASINDLASVLRYEGNYDEAEELYRRALQGREGALGKDHAETLMSVSGLAEVLWYRGNYRDAELLHRRALDGKKMLLGKEHPETLISVTSLAWMLQYQGKFEEAEVMSRQALDGKEAVLGKEHPETLTSVHNLAWILLCRGAYGEAAVLSRRALDGRGEVLGKCHPSTLTSASNLAEVLRCRGEYREAEALHRQVLYEKELVLGMAHPSTLTSVNNLASVLHDRGKYEEAELLCHRALDENEKVLGREHPETLASVSCLAHLFLCQKRYQLAAKLYDRACNGYKKVFGTGHPTTIACEQGYSSLLQIMNS